MLNFGDLHIKQVVQQLETIGKFAKSALERCGILEDFDLIKASIASQAELKKELNEANLSQLAKEVQINGSNNFELKQ